MNVRSIAVAVALAMLALLPSTASAVPGDLDGSFAGTGFITPNSPTGKIAVQDDGSILAAGVERNPKRIVLRRYLPTGQLDLDFGDRGEATVPRPEAPGGTGVAGIAIAPDDSIVLAAGLGTGDLPSIWLLARFTPAGELDPAFGSGGVSLTTLPSTDFDAITLDSQGRIVGAGTGGGDPTLLARFDQAGRLDPTFSADGVQQLRMSIADQVLSVGDQILVGGRPAYDDEQSGDVVVVRVNADGAIDGIFGVGGYAFANSGVGFSAAADSMVQTPDHRTLIGVLSCSIQIHTGAYYCASAVIAFTPQGTLDLGFGDGGQVSNIGDSIVASSDGSIYVGGSRSPGRRYPEGSSVTKLTSSGQLDPSYSRNGVAYAYVDDIGAVDQLIAAPGGGLIAFSGSIIRFSEAALPANADADALLDADDRCELFAASSPTGCPKVRRAIGIGVHDNGVNIGLGSDIPACTIGIRVTLLRARPGADRVIGKARTRPSGSTKRIRLDAPGRYHAVVRRQLKTHFAVCGRARSKAVPFE
jgi:uncharacterized delta-60 repeat protein